LLLVAVLASEVQGDADTCSHGFVSIMNNGNLAAVNFGKLFNTNGSNLSVVVGGVAISFNNE